jgi:Protein of unknown function (DUF3592)
MCQIMPIGNAIDEMVARSSRSWNHPKWWNLLVVLPWLLGLAFLIQESRTESRIAARQQTTSGIVTAHEPANHNRYGYKFEVNDKTYTGWQSPGNAELSIGKQVIVFYDPQNPSRSALTDFHDLSRSSLGPVPMLLFGIGAITLFILSRRRPNKTTSKGLK